MSHFTLEQRRAADAWKKAQGCTSGYRNLAKSLPALIMNSGLMQVLAFMHEKGAKEKQSHHQVLGDHLRDWLHKRFEQEITGADFEPFIESLMRADPALFQRITAEAMAWLRWSRQMAAAACADSGGRR